MCPDEESFKVTDRRGHSREWAEGPSTPPAPPPGAHRGAPEPPRSQSAPGPRPGTPPEEAGADLGGIFVMFASSALVHLGEAADPMTGERSVDLDQARGAIDVLLLLKDKTEGNRTAEESRLLEEILYDLQLRFVRATSGHRGP